MSGLGRALGGFARQNAIALIALFVALGGGAYAATGGGGFLSHTGTINGCVASKGGALTVLKPGKRCPRHTRALHFNVAGRPGAAGATGNTGQLALRALRALRVRPGRPRRLTHRIRIRLRSLTRQPIPRQCSSLPTEGRC